MAKRRLGIGLIGGGFVARFHIRSLAGVRDADINGIVSRSSQTAAGAAELARKVGVGEPKTYKSVEDLVADPSIDAVWICSPNFTRLEVMEEIVGTLEAGKGELIGVCCEKPLGRNAAEARRMLELAEAASLLHGYLENQLFTPGIVRGKEIVWARGVALTGPPYLARAAEEHRGPHASWFWEGELQGGGVLNDMMCHSVEVARFLLTPPGARREHLTPVRVSAYTSCLKWQQPHYAEILARNSDGALDYLKRPAEDFARSLIEYRDPGGETRIVETTTSWCFVGAGLRLTMELLGPEYSMSINSLEMGPKLFFSREVRGGAGEDLVEKQNAETGVMPVVASEEAEYGYEGENRHMVRALLAARSPDETFHDGLNVTELLMTAYMSAEEARTIDFPPPGLDSFVPAVARGEWQPGKERKGREPR